MQRAELLLRRRAPEPLGRIKVILTVLSKSRLSGGRRGSGTADPMRSRQSILFSCVRIQGRFLLSFPRDGSHIRIGAA